jgi:hypothetical protein
MWDKKGMKPGHHRNGAGLEPENNRNGGGPTDSQPTEFPGLLPEILNLIPAADLNKLYIDDPEGRFQRFLPRATKVLTEGLLNQSTPAAH